MVAAVVVVVVVVCRVSETVRGGASPGQAATRVRAS